MTPRIRILAILFAAVVFTLIVLGLITNFLVDWSWFASLGFVGVFWTVVAAKLALFLVAAAVTAAAVYGNCFVAQRLAGFRTSFRTVPSPWDSLQGVTQPVLIEQLYRRFPWRLLVVIASLAMGVFVGLGQIGNWDVALRYLNQAPYGQADPLFGRDIGFYLFSLPAYVALKDWLVSVLAVSALGTAVLYWVHGALAFNAQRRWVAPAAIAHGSVLLGLYFLVKAWGYWLDRFMLVYGDNDVVVGAGYADVHVQLPALWLLLVLALAAAVACLWNARQRTIRLPLIAVAAIAGVAIFLVPLATALFQRLYVKPNELRFEAPYIARNIALTREAYKLSNIEVKPFAADQALTYESLQNNRATVDNIRLWDWEPLLDTYGQLQELRPYYKFRDADIDRYWLNGRYQQVISSARELEPSLLQQNAQTWVNLHVLFTHGSGIVMSPVTRTTPDGLPVLYLQDIPPIAAGGPPVSEPRIYFGESPDSYVIVKGSAPEFDYPKGDKNVYAYYDGADGVPVGGLARRALFAWHFGDLNILLSEYITGSSRIVFRRNIQDRVRRIAPFLTLDKDPYVVVSGGRLYWIQDAYTTSEWFPYSKPMPDSSANYIRNAVKVVIDAYNGTVDFYVVDAADPVVATYARIFPRLFKPFAAMPADLQKHVRYPEDLFRIQAEIYRSYHMDAPEVFYNREDLWQFPRLSNSTDDSGNAKTMAPYFINMRLPGETQTEFVLMLPMVPNQRDNMIAWLAARCDQPDYGKLIVYTFPKDKLLYGPSQIVALINQNTEVSQQISLWNQMGSRVIWGNLLVVPIEDSLLYVTPLYLRAQTGQLPELKRVIAVYGGHVVMRETLADSLAALFKPPEGTIMPSATATPSTTAAPSAVPAATPLSDAARAALEHYRRAMEKLKAGDWAGFGAELDALRPLLEEMGKAPKPAKP